MNRQRKTLGFMKDDIIVKEDSIIFTPLLSDEAYSRVYDLSDKLQTKPSDTVELNM